MEVNFKVQISINGGKLDTHTNFFMRDMYIDEPNKIAQVLFKHNGVKEGDKIIIEYDFQGEIFPEEYEVLFSHYAATIYEKKVRLHNGNESKSICIFDKIHGENFNISEFEFPELNGLNIKSYEHLKIAYEEFTGMFK